MNIKKNIRQIVLTALWMVLAGAVLFVLVAAINKKNHDSCSSVVVDIDGIGEYYFVDKKDVLNVIAPGGNNSVKGRSIQSFDLRRLEETLEKNIWIKDAELFFDNNNMLRVNITERTPVARIFTVSGHSFYIDSSSTRLPLSDKMSVKLPVVTNFPTEATRLSSADSLLMQQLKHLSVYIGKDDFWMAQIAQIDITPQRTFELVPVIGNHIIQFGNGDDYQLKLHRLMIFYKTVLSKTGFDKYAAVNVAYAKQVVAVKRGTVTKIDSLQALKNIQLLILQSKQMQPDTLSTSVDKKRWSSAEGDTSLSLLMDEAPMADTVRTVKKIPIVVNKNPPPKTKPTSTPLKKPVPVVPEKNTPPKPKALMPKKTG